MPKFLNSSCEHLDRIEYLLAGAGRTEHAITPWHHALAERAKVTPPDVGSATGRWLRSLTNSDANRIIDALEANRDELA